MGIRMDTNSLSYDILKEIFNIGVGKAAEMLSEIIDRKVILDVPDILILEKEDKKIDKVKNIPLGTVMVSSIDFQKDINGKAKLIFPANKMKSFLDLCKGEEGDEDLGFTDLDFDILKEVGNIILNSLVGEIGNMLNLQLKYTLPVVDLFHEEDFSKILSSEEGPNIILYISFLVEEIEIEGAIIIDLTLRSLRDLNKIIKMMEEDLNG